MDIILIRHAESIANTQSVYQGRTYDTELSDRGKKQAEVLAKALTKFSTINAIYTSPLQRTFQTAVTISKSALLPEPILDGRLLEINHGIWEGLPISDIQAQFPELYQAWKTEPDTVTFPQGENLQTVTDRVLDFLQEITKNPHQRVLIVTHDAVIRVLLTKLLRRELRDIWIYQLDAAGYSVVEWNDKLPTVVKINENSHLNGLASDLTAHAL